VQDPHHPKQVLIHLTHEVCRAMTAVSHGTLTKRMADLHAALRGDLHLSGNESDLVHAKPRFRWHGSTTLPLPRKAHRTIVSLAGRTHSLQRNCNSSTARQPMLPRTKHAKKSCKGLTREAHIETANPVQARPLRRSAFGRMWFPTPFFSALNQSTAVQGPLDAVRPRSSNLTPSVCSKSAMAFETAAE
jgi:hypothetical protein